MNKKQKQQTILGGSITLSLVLGLGAGVGIGAAVWKTANANGGVQNITFYSNQDYYLDKGFNEGTYNGVTKYGQNNDLSIGIQTSDAYYDFGQGDQYAQSLIKIFDKAEYVVTSGGNVAEVLDGAMWGPVGDNPWAQIPVTPAQTDFFNKVVSNEEDSMILLDDTANYLANTINERFVSVSYASEDAGFAAGIAASVYSSSIHLNNDLGIIEGTTNKVGIWGGVTAPTIAFLSGFEQGVNYFNYLTFGVTPDSTWDNNDKLVKITTDGDATINYGAPQSISTGTPEAGETDSWYTGSFELDTTQGAGEIAKMKAMDMVAKDVNVIFPVAGGQTIIALDQINDGDQTKIIGVDTPAADSQSGSSKEKILGSSVKELASSAEFALWYERDFKPTFDDKYADNANIDNLSFNDVQYFMETYMPSSPYKGDMDAYKFAAAATVDATHVSLEDIDLGNTDVITSDDGSGWNTTKEVVTPGNKGSSFYGTYENGGVGFTTNGSYLDDAYEAFSDFEINSTETLPPTFLSFLQFALENQEGISKASVTFGSAAEGITNDNDNGNLWDITYKI